MFGNEINFTVLKTNDFSMVTINDDYKGMILIQIETKSDVITKKALVK
ncbi:MAG: hypothetical protein K9G76_04790 [Bacteroidales bacterium]|nr:hypothetical protein [Bacteroidales bacterium]MCF8402995.1 hypothetical protein [Bacteroidales bacterium]